MKENNKLKKQIVSGGIYIALAAAVVTVTLNGVKNIIGSTEDYEIPDVNMELQDISFDEISKGDDLLKESPDLPDPEISLKLPENSEPGLIKPDLIGADVDDEKVGSPEVRPSGNHYEGVSSDTVSKGNEDVDVAADNVSASGEPDDVEYPTEPDPVSYDVYAKPAEGYIEKEFSEDDLLYSVTMGDYRTHNGIDITGDPGSAVKAINAGTVTDIYYDDFYGNTIEIDHGNGMIAYYMNLSETFPQGIKKGVKVSHGQIIGGIGNSAVIESAEVSHLHLSIKVNGEYTDPRTILRGNY